MTSIFLSYGRGDDESFVARLCADLKSHGFAVWLDVQNMPSRGSPFPIELRDAINASDRFLFVLGPRAVTSDWCQAEWRHALAFGIPITPVLRLDGKTTEGNRLDGLKLLPDEMLYLHVDDFRDDANYPANFQRLVNQLRENPEPLGKLIGVPSLPSSLLERREKLKSLKDELLGDFTQPVAITGLHGMGGIGKSVLANLLARDPAVRRTFPDGIAWIHLGTRPNLLKLQQDLARGLGDERLFDNKEQGRVRLTDILAPKKLLLILDDLWKRSHAEAFNILHQRCRAVVTSRDAGLISSLGAREYEVQLLDDAEAFNLLASIAGVNSGELPPAASELASECGYLPLALALSAGMVKRGRSWTSVLQRLQEARLERIADDHAENVHHQSLWAAMKVSVDALTADERQRFIELSVFPGNQTVPEAAVRTLWPLEEPDSEDLLISLSERSLIRLDYTTPEADQASTRRVSLHAVLHDYASRMAGGPILLHQQLTAGYRKLCSNGWSSGPNDGYFLQNIVRHLSLANESEELYALLEDERWQRVKRDFDPSLSSYVADIEIGIERAEAIDPPDYASLATLSLIAARAKEQVQDVPLEALSALTRLGKWRQALAYVRAIEPPERGLYALRKMAELLREMGDTEAFRLIVNEGLQYANVLDPTLAQFDASASSLEESLAQLAEKCSADTTTTLVEWIAIFADASQVEEYRTRLMKIDLAETRFVLLEPRFDSVTKHQWYRLFREIFLDHLAYINFPRSSSPEAQEYELGSLWMVRKLASSTVKKVDVETVRSLAGELWGLIDQPEKALALLAEADRPMNRLTGMAIVVQAFGRAGREELVKRIWTMLEPLDSIRYAGAAAERCAIMLRMVGAFLPFGDEEQAKLPMGSAVIFAMSLGLSDSLPLEDKDSVETMLHNRKRRQLIEEQLIAHGGNTALGSIQTRALVQEAALNYLADDGSAKVIADRIRSDVLSATPESWKTEPTVFRIDQALAFCVLGTALFRVRDVTGAESAWRRAIELAETIENETQRARVLASMADAFAVAGWRAPAIAFCRQFLSLMEKREASSKDRGHALARWSVACIAAGQTEEGINLAQQITEPDLRLDALASAALAYARSGDGEQSRPLVATILQTVRSGDYDRRRARATAKTIVVFSLLNDAQSADDVEREALSLAETCEREPDRLDSLIEFIDTLNREGEGDRTVRIIEAYDDVATRGVMIAALAYSVAADVTHLEKSDFVNIANWGLSTAAAEMNQSEYHTALALLLLSNALGISGKSQEVAALGQFEGDFVLAVAVKAFETMSALLARDGEIGTLRCYSVFRIAGRLTRLAPKSIENQQWEDLWEWVQSERARETADLTSKQFVEALSVARTEDTRAVWRGLAASGSLLASAGAAASTWLRLEAVDAAQSQDEDSASMAEIFANSVKDFREVAERTASSGYRARHAEEDADEGPPPKGALLKAARYTDESRILRLLALGVDINEEDSQGTTALMYAVSMGLESVVRLLLINGADPNHIQKNGRSALFNVTDGAIARLLIEAGADIGRSLPDGRTPMSEAVIYHQPEVLKVLLEHGCDPNAVNVNGAPLLYEAIAQELPDAVELLIRCGANVNLPSVEGLPPLMFAAIGSSEAMVRILVQRGASIDGRGVARFAGGTALMMAAIKQNEGALYSLLEMGASVDLAREDGGTAIILAASEGAIAIVRALLDRGADVEKAKANGRTALGEAAAEGHEAVVRLLLERGADANHPQDENGGTPLMYAAARGQVGVLAELVEHGVETNQTTPSGWTALMSAAWRNQVAAAMWLIDQGADVNHATADGITALSKAALEGHEGIVSSLITRGVDPNRNVEDGVTVLFIVAGSGSNAMVNRLLEEGASVDLGMSDGTTPLMAAAGNGHDDVIRTLLARGADIKRRTNEDGTALMFAAQSGHLSTVELLLGNGAEPRQAMIDGRTALDFAIDFDHEPVAELLRSRM